ncbi:hypothetical protein EDD15DRAFT_696041 [Pisolithus albus]|nr:hypothetical protein EDD15DRAFT_696041 [Pisolithus albus]
MITTQDLQSSQTLILQFKMRNETQFEPSFPPHSSPQCVTGEESRIPIKFVGMSSMCLMRWSVDEPAVRPWLTRPQIQCDNRYCKFSSTHPSTCVPPAAPTPAGNSRRQFPQQYNPRIDALCPRCLRGGRIP